MTFENKHTPEAREKAVKKMLGGIKERLAKAKASRKLDQIDAPDVAEFRKIASDDLVIANSEAPAPLETIHFNTDPFPEMPERLGGCPDKLEPNLLNLTARESLERQISDLMDKVNQALRERKFLIKDALNVLEFARTTACTQPMGEVSVNLFEGAKRLSDIEPELSNTVNRLANLAMEIKQSEQIRGGK